MNEVPPASSLSSAMQVLHAPIQARTPWLDVMEIVTDHDRPCLRVKDTANGILVDRQGGKAHE